MDLNLTISIFSSLTTFFTAYTAMKAYKISKDQTAFLKRTEADKNAPFLYPTSHELTKDKWERFYFSISQLDDVVPKKNYNDLEDSEKQFCDDTKNHTSQTYFYYLNDQIYLIINARSNKPSYIIEHNNAKIEFKNYGALITKIHIDYIEQYFVNSKKPIRFEGCEESYYTDVILPNQKLTIFLDEVKDSSDFTSCIFGKEEYDKMQNTNFFENCIPEIINYNKYLVRISVWNQYNVKYEFDIIIKRIGNRFYREVIKIE